MVTSDTLEAQYILHIFLFCFSSNPSCTDILEIYSAVEEMDDDDEASLQRIINKKSFVLQTC